MGTNLQKKAQKSYQKHIDNALKEVSAGDLFDEIPVSCPRQFVAEPTRGSRLKMGDKVSLELDGPTVLGTQGPHTVLRVNTPPSEIVTHLKSKSGIAEANITKVNRLSGTVEVDLC